MRGGSGRGLAILGAALRYGLPLTGLVVIGHAVLISIGGDIEHWEFALGALLIALGFGAGMIAQSGR